MRCSQKSTQRKREREKRRNERRTAKNCSREDGKMEISFHFYCQLNKRYTQHTEWDPGEIDKTGIEKEWALAQVEQSKSFPTTHKAICYSPTPHSSHTHIYMHVCNTDRVFGSLFTLEKWSFNKYDDNQRRKLCNRNG